MRVSAASPYESAPALTRRIRKCARVRARWPRPIRKTPCARAPSPRPIATRRSPVSRAISPPRTPPIGGAAGSAWPPARGEGAGRTIVANLSSWCVDPPYRALSGGLAAAATRDKSVVYVNISAAPHTRAGVEAQGYRRTNAGQFLFAPALAKRAQGARARPFDAARAEPGLAEEERALLSDHAALGCRAFVVDCDGRSYGFATVGERVLRGKLPCDLVVHCGGLDRLARFAGALGRDMRLKLLIVDAPGPIPGLVGKFIAGRNPRYAKGPGQLDLGDLAYTERVYLAT